MKFNVLAWQATRQKCHPNYNVVPQLEEQEKKLTLNAKLVIVKRKSKECMSLINNIYFQI